MELLTSDCESILTEDFASKFTEILTENSKDSGYYCNKSEKYSDSYSNHNNKLSKSIINKDQIQNDKRKQTINQGVYYQNHGESEITENKFSSVFQNYKMDPNSVSSRSVPPESCSTSFTVDMGNISNVQPMRRDIMSKFLEKYSIDENQIMTELINDERKKDQNNPNENSKKLLFTGTNSNEQKLDKEKTLRNSLANEIRSKSLKIQNEIHLERRRKRMDSIQEHTPRETLDLKVKELDHLTNRMRQARLDRERIAAEVDALENKLKFKSNEIHKDAKWNMGNKNGSEIKSYPNRLTSNQIQITENQLSHLNFELNQKKIQLKDLESVIHQRLREIKDLECLGLSKQEIEQVIEERNDLYEILRQNEENGQDRYELEKKLSEVKEDLSFEHKKSREKIAKLEEELDHCFKKINELYEERDKLGNDFMAVKDNFQRQQDDMNDLYQERNDLRCQVERYKDEMESERATCRDLINQERKRLESHLATEEAQSKLKLAELRNEISSLHQENQTLNDKNSSLKSKLSQIEEECQILKLSMDYKENEFKECLMKNTEEKNHVIERLKKDLYTIKENEIQSLKTEFDSEQMRTISNLKDCFKQQLQDLQLRNESKTQEAQDLRGEIRRLKQEYFDKEENIKRQYETEISYLKNEIRRNSDFLEGKRNSETEDIRNRYEALIGKIKKEIDEERLMNERLRNAVEKANQEIAHESELVKRYRNEKISSINRVKELAKEKLQVEYKNLKHFYEKELEEQLQIVEKTMQEKNSQLISKCKEIRQIRSENEEQNLNSIHYLNELIEILKQECCEMAKEAKFILPQWKTLRINENEDIASTLQATMRNLQICCQEYKQFYHEFSEKLKADKDLILKEIDEKHVKDIEIIREQISKNHAVELNSLNMYHKRDLNEMKSKHKEEIETMRMNVKTWKCKTAERLAQKLQKEFRKEIERKSGKTDVRMSSSLSLNSFKHEGSINYANPIGLIEDLRGNIKQLREENLSLRKVIVSKSSTLPFDDANCTLQSGLSVSCNGNNSPITTCTRPQSACNENYRNRNNSKDKYIQRSNSFKNYS